MNTSNTLNTLSPLDGRYANSIKDLSAYFSESALMGYRLKVEIEYLIALGSEKGIKELRPFPKMNNLACGKSMRTSIRPVQKK